MKCQYSNNDFLVIFSIIFINRHCHNMQKNLKLNLYSYYILLYLTNERISTDDKYNFVSHLKMHEYLTIKSIVHFMVQNFSSEVPMISGSFARVSDFLIIYCRARYVYANSAIFKFYCSVGTN